MREVRFRNDDKPEYLLQADVGTITVQVRA
jgi:hypothetical protein